jgi:NAD(P)H-hydrate epimerase
MKILSSSQTRQADAFTIENEPVSSINLMERAALGLVQQLFLHFAENTHYIIFCGKGNNGGDGLALARLLYGRGCRVNVIIVEHSSSSSSDFDINFERLRNTDVQIQHLTEIGEMAALSKDAVIVDGILGSGLSRPLEGLIAEVVQVINETPQSTIAIDIPTGLFADDNSGNQLAAVVRADYTYTFQYPKLCMMHKDTAPLCGYVHTIDIGLHPGFLGAANSTYYFLRKCDLVNRFIPRKKFTYKGSYGHGLLLGGSKGSMGAPLLSAKAALRAGAGLLSVAIPGSGVLPLQAFLPEAMVIADDDDDKLSSLPNIEKFTAYGIGPGMGTHKASATLLKKLLETCSQPMVLDADALNMIANERELFSILPNRAILTPHPGEFKRLLGVDKLESDYLDRLRELAKKHQIIVILKDAITAIALSDGTIYFSDFGSPALASPGSGDVLTGVILGLLSSGYSPESAALLGVYVQARAGTLAGESLSLEATLASDVIAQIASVFKELY